MYMLEVMVMTEFENKLTEEKLAEEKKRLDTVKAPKELEGRLRKALDQTPKHPKRSRPKWITVAVALLFLSLAIYQYDAFAYYSKKLFGFDELMSATLIQLNEAGNGQSIEQKVVLPDGSEFLLNGLITDENQLILYYTITNPKGLKNDVHFFNLTGFLTEAAPTSGTYSTNDENTEMKGIQSFESVSPFAKRLTLQILVENEELQMHEVPLVFTYKPNTSLQTELKKSIKKSVEVDRGKIRFNSITATPTRTTIKGKLKVTNFDRYTGAIDGIKLIANGVPIEGAGASIKSGFNGSTLEVYFDALPKKVANLKLLVDTFVGYTAINKTFSLEDLTGSYELIPDKALFIRKIEQTEDGIQLTIATAEDVMLENVSVQVRGQSIPLITTVRQDYVEDENGESYKERILLFGADELPDALFVEGMHYKKSYEQSIDIKVK